ncbi:MAG: hypothetical protein Q9163_001558 [Psora crenata]
MTAQSSSPYASTKKPIDEVVSNAFDRAETSSYVPPPELIAHITQNVIKQLQTGALDGSTPVQSQGPFAPPPQFPPGHQPIPQSPSTTASGTSPNMPNRVFTPPSPQKQPDHPNHTSPPTQPSHPPEPPQSPSKGHKPAHFSPNRPSSPLSQSSETSEKPHMARPRGPSRLHTGKEETTLERIWGQLFDEQSRPTARLGQLLRGLAVHIIEDYEPRHSIVITPAKMVKYYEDVKLANERYPWSTVFDDERSSISRMYRDLACEHHLVQERHDERPDIPGLTPAGFERWVTLLIQAHPEAEFERLQKAVLEMPISNPDDKRERFPKEISRRLFPTDEDHEVRQRIENSMVEHASIEIARRTSQEEPKPRRESPAHKPSIGEQYVPQHHRPSVSFADPEATPKPTPSYIPSHIERERAPYSNVPDTPVVDGTKPPDPPVAKPIERERKPYSAQVGGGKQYEAEDLRPREASKPRADTIMSSSSQKPSRSDSNAGHTRPISIASSNQIPKPEIHQSHHAPSNASSGRRRRSPSFSRGTTSDFRRSDSDIRTYGPSFESGSVPRNLDSAFDEPDTRRYFDEQARQRAERARRKAEEESRVYGEIPRRGYDDRIPRRGDYPNDEEYWRAGGRRDKGYDDGYQQPYGGPLYR